MNTIKIRVTPKHLQGSYADNHDCPMARALIAAKFIVHGVGGTYARVTDKQSNNLMLQLPGYWCDSFVDKARRSRKTITVQVKY